MNRLVVTKKCIVLEIVGAVLCVIALILGAVQALTLSGPIPTHYTITGVPDAYGSPVSALFLPGIMLAAVGLMAICLHLVPPEKWNKPFAIRPGHEITVYQDIALMVAILEPGIGAFSMLLTIANWINRSDFTMAVVIGLLVYLVAVIIGMVIKAFLDNRG